MSESIEMQLSKITPQYGDVLIFKYPEEAGASPDGRAEIAATAQALFDKTGCYVICLPLTMALEVTKRKDVHTLLTMPGLG